MIKDFIEELIKVLNSKSIKNLSFVLLWFYLFNLGQFIGIIVQFAFAIIAQPDFLNSLIKNENLDLLNSMPNIILFCEIASFILIGLIFVFIFKDRLKELFRPIKISKIFICIGFAITSYIFICIVLTLLPSWFSATAEESVSLALSGTSALTTWIAVGLLGPIVEELTFRGGIIHSLEDVNINTAIIISAIVFGIAHGNLSQGIYAAFLGIVFALMNKKYNSMIPGIIMHITINSISVILTFFV